MSEEHDMYFKNQVVLSMDDFTVHLTRKLCFYESFDGSVKCLCLQCSNLIMLDIFSFQLPLTYCMFNIIVAQLNH